MSESRAVESLRNKG